MPKGSELFLWEVSFEVSQLYFEPFLFESLIATRFHFSIFDVRTVSIFFCNLILSRVPFVLPLLMAAIRTLSPRLLALSPKPAMVSPTISKNGHWSTYRTIFEMSYFASLKNMAMFTDKHLYNDFKQNTKSHQQLPVRLNG